MPAARKVPDAQGLRLSGGRPTATGWRCRRPPAATLTEAGWEPRRRETCLIAMLEVDRLTKRYHRVAAVQDVSFSIRPGEILGYLGPNGAGKSTTVKILIGLLEPGGGRVLMDGRSVIE